MKNRVEFISLKINIGAGRKKHDYMQIIYDDIEIGFVNQENVYLKLFLPGNKLGAYMPILPKNTEHKTFQQKTSWIKKNWEAVYDRYNLIVRGN